MKKANKKATKDRKKITIKDLKPKAKSQIKGGLRGGQPELVRIG